MAILITSSSALLNDRKYHTIWNWRMPITCDLIHRHIVAREYLQHFVQRQLQPFAIRSYAIVASKEAEVKLTILSLDRKLTERKYPSWTKVLVLAKRGHENNKWLDQYQVSDEGPEDEEDENEADQNRESPIP